MIASFTRCFFIACLFFSRLTILAQSLPSKYVEQLNPDSIRKYLYTLSSDAFEGRETGRPGQKKAALFLTSRYKSWGLLPGIKESENISSDSNIEMGFLQKHPISLKNNKGRNLAVNGKYFLYGRDFIYPPTSTDTVLYFSDITFIGLGKKDYGKPNFNNALNANEFKGKDILCKRTPSADIHDDSLIHFLSINEPASIFIVTDQDHIEKYFTYGFNSLSRTPFPVIFITEEVAQNFFEDDKYESIIRKINRSGKSIKKNLECSVSVSLIHDSDELCGENVIAFIKGYDPGGETVIISSHYDHLGIVDSLIMHGADDNASGTSAVLELARVFVKAKNEGHVPRRNILFMNVSGEEKGLFGSSWYVAHPAFTLEKTITDLNIDMIGRLDHFHDSTGSSNYIYIIGSDKMSTELHDINELQNKNGPQLILDYKYNSNDDPNHFYARSDHYNFVKKGIPVIFYFDGIHADYHKSTDIADKINFGLLTTRASLVFLTAWELANRTERIIIDKK